MKFRYAVKPVDKNADQDERTMPDNAEPMRNRENRVPETGPATSRAGHAVLNGFAVLVLVLMAAICLQVLCSFFDINPLVSFSREVPLFGRAVTLNSLLDAQWHLLAVIGLLPAGLVWWRDGHVRVDFLYDRLGPAGRARIELLGYVLFTVPFLFMCMPAAMAFVASAWRSDQGSPNDGLNDLWLIKAVLPIGLAVLALVVTVDAVRLLRRAAGRR